MCSQYCLGSSDGYTESRDPSLDSTNRTFLDLSRHPSIEQTSSDPLLNCDSLRYQLPIPNKVWGWLTPAKPCSPPILTKELSVAGDQAFTVGREQQCDLVLEEFMFQGSDENLQCNKTSRVQFEILLENDRPYIVDKSMNGTFVNGDKLSK